jgi:hypothetical protein
MKTISTVLLTLLIPFSLLAQSFVESIPIEMTYTDVTSSTVVGEVTVEPESTGKVVVTFDGYCLSSPGDLIVLAASNSQNWSPNDGNTSVEAISTDLNRNSFSHTRVYDVNAGSHTFYAIAHNYVETAGSGEAAIYGHLTVEFFPADYVVHQGISQTGLDVNDLTTVGEVTINAPTSGTVKVWFDGLCYATPGDRIVLGCNNAPNWTVNDGNIGIESVDNDYNSKPFSHSRVFNVGAGNHTFYAVAQNYVETAGDGITSIYASLTAVFVPDDNNDLLGVANVAEGALDVTDEQVVGEVTLNPTVPGKVVVHFDGECISSPGDRIILAASDQPSWSPNAGATSVEAYDSDVNSNSFSHTRVYAVTPGSQTFYAIAHNYVETDGNGIAGIYGTLSVIFIPDAPNAVQDRVEESAILVAPNPTTGPVRVTTDWFRGNFSYYQVLDANGQLILQGHINALQNRSLDLSGYADGLYLLQLIDEHNQIVKTQKIIKTNF